MPTLRQTNIIIESEVEFKSNIEPPMTQSNEPSIEPKLTKEGYLVYPDGKVIGKTGVELKLKVGSAGYVLLNTWTNSKRKTYSLHRVVAELFVPNPKTLPEVNHKDGNKLNNHYSNLEWSTRPDNINHAFEAGLNKGTWKGKSGRLHFRSKGVIQIDASGNEVARFGSIREAQRVTGIKSIDMALSGRYRHAGGYKWHYYNQQTTPNAQTH